MYVTTNRTINGSQVRYIEHLTSREVKTVFDYQFLDCCSTYDGRNTSSTSMGITGGTSWVAGDVGTVTASSTVGWANFFASDVGNEIWLFYTFTFASSVAGANSGTLTTAVTPGSYAVMFSNGESRLIVVGPDGLSVSWTDQTQLASGLVMSAQLRARCLITNYVSTTQATVRFKDPVPVMLRNATTTWTFARTSLTGAPQLANMPVVALIDANVYGINATGVTANGSITVNASGGVTLPTAGGVVQLGLPYTFDFETLPLNEQGQATIRHRAKMEPVVFIDVHESRNFLIGTNFSDVTPHKERAFEPYVSPTNIQIGAQWVRVKSDLAAETHSCIRQNMPLPLTIRMHIPGVGIGEPIS
jgi:hypothetical protein